MCPWWQPGFSGALDAGPGLGRFRSRAREQMFWLWEPVFVTGTWPPHTRERGDTDPATSQCKRSQHRGQAQLCWSTPALPLASGAPQVLWESYQAESPAARAHTEPLPTHAPGGPRPHYLGGGAQNRGQGVPLQEVGQLGRAAQGPAGLQPVGGLRGAGLRVAERHPQRVRGGLGQLGTDHTQVGQVRGTVQAAAQPGAVGRVLRCRGA